MVSEEFIRIFKTNVIHQELVSNINYLKEADVLTIEESELCNSMLEQLELTNKIDLKKSLTQLLDKENVPDFENIEGYERLELESKIDEFIKERKKEKEGELLELLISELEHGEISKNATKVFFDKYIDIVDIKDDNVYDNLGKIEDVEINISSCVDFIDEKIHGLQNGTLTTIIGEDDVCKSMWAINVAYEALLQGKNILYLTPSYNKETIYKRFIVRHSCDVNRFDKPFTFDDPYTDYDKDNYLKVYSDFKMNYLKHLILFDESEFIISTRYNLQKLIAYAEDKFLKATGDGISLIVFDDFTQMKLDNGRRSITNIHTIISEYYKYLKNQARNLLGTERKISILTTINSYYLYDVRNNVPKELKVLSDNIFSIYADVYRKNPNKFEISVLQSYNGYSSDYTKTVPVDYKYWHIKKEETPEESFQSLLEKEKEENKILRSDLNFAKNIINTSDILQSSLALNNILE